MYKKSPYRVSTVIKRAQRRLYRRARQHSTVSNAVGKTFKAVLTWAEQTEAALQKVRWEICTLHKHKGGLGILNVTELANRLNSKWMVKSLLLPNEDWAILLHRNINLARLKDHPKWRNHQSLYSLAYLAAEKFSSLWLSSPTFLIYASISFISGQEAAPTKNGLNQREAGLLENGQRADAGGSDLDEQSSPPLLWHTEGGSHTWKSLCLS